MGRILDNYEEADSAFKSDLILQADDEALLRHLYGLSNQNNLNTGTQHRDVIRGITINTLLLKNHIEKLNKQNNKTQCVVVWLTVVATLSAIAQVVVPLLIPSRAAGSEPEKTIAQPIAPIPAKPQSSDPANARKN